MDDYNQLTENQMAESATQTATQTETQKETKVGLESLNDLPRIEDLLRSEKEIKPAPEIKGLKKVENATASENKTFALKKDENKAYVKKRVKVLTSVYITVAALLFVFVFSNAITMAVLSNTKNSNADTIQNEANRVADMQTHQPQEETAAGSFVYSINEPRDYSDDTKELTFFDKLSILFRNLFG